MTSSESASTNNTPRLQNNSAIKSIIQENTGLSVNLECEDESKTQTPKQEETSVLSNNSQSLEEMVGLAETVVSLEQVKIRRNQYVYDRNSISVAIGDLMTPI